MNSSQRAARRRRRSQKTAVTKSARRFVELLRGEEGMTYYEVVTATAVVRIAFSSRLYGYGTTVTGVFDRTSRSVLRRAIESAVTTLGAEAVLDEEFVPGSDPRRVEITATFERTYGTGQTLPNGTKLSELVVLIRKLAGKSSIVREGFVFLPDSTTDMPVHPRFRPSDNGYWRLAA